MTREHGRFLGTLGFRRMEIISMANFDGSGSGVVGYRLLLPPLGRSWACWLGGSSHE